MKDEKKAARALRMMRGRWVSLLNKNGIKYSPECTTKELQDLLKLHGIKGTRNRRTREELEALKFSKANSTVPPPMGRRYAMVADLKVDESVRLNRKYDKQVGTWFSQMAHRYRQKHNLTAEQFALRVRPDPSDGRYTRVWRVA